MTDATPAEVVLCVIVAEDRQPVSRYFSSPDAAGEHLDAFRIKYPGAHIVQYTFLRADAELLETLERVRVLDRQEFGLPQRDEIKRLRERDKLRTALQTPIAAPAYTVHYHKPGSKKEYRSPFLYRSDHADQALAMMQAKYGNSNAVILVH